MRTSAKNKGQGASLKTLLLSLRRMAKPTVVAGEEKELGLGPLKRYGTRYGKTVKVRAAKIEFEQRKPQLCPNCLKPSARRLAVGIYKCKKCNAKFTGRAYSVSQIIEKSALPEVVARIEGEASKESEATREEIELQKTKEKPKEE